jgi:hypothetical protein
MTEQTLDQKLHSLIEREREILKKISVAYRAGASDGVMGQLDFMLEECRADQMETRMLLKSDRKDSGFDDFLSIG